MKRLDAKQFSNDHEYQQAKKQLKKHTYKQREARKKNGNLHILAHSGEAKEIGGVFVDEKL